MKINAFTVVAAGILALSPVAAAAQNVAASLSASFGTSPPGTTSVNVGGASVTTVTPQSLSVAAAAGARTVAGSVATPFSSGAAAGAGNQSDELSPYANVTNNGNAYEVKVAFENVGLSQQIAALQSQIDDNDADIASILSDVCSLANWTFDGAEGTVEIAGLTDAVVTGLNVGATNVDLGFFGSFTIVNSVSASSGPVPIQGTGAFTPAGDVVCTPTS